MKGLLLKDWLVVVKQTKIYFVLMAAFALVPGMGIYSIFFGALLPVTAFAYDERSKWDQMADMMPYSSREVVIGKYVFGYMAVGGVVLLELLIWALYKISGVSQAGGPGSVFVILVSVVTALTVMALDIPVMFFIGVEKSRIVLMFVTIFVMLGIQSAFSPAVFGETVFMPPEWNSFMSLGLLLAAGAVQLASITVSSKLYQAKTGKR